MYILNLEDNVFKHHDICKAIENASFKNVKIDRVDNLSDGIELLLERRRQEQMYDLIITDMWYPEQPGGGDAASGEKLIDQVKELGLNIPIIVCSSINYYFPDILGSVHYSEKEDWESELVSLMRQLDL